MNWPKSSESSTTLSRQVNKFEVRKYSQCSEWYIISFRYLCQSNSICSLYLNKRSYSGWRHDSCSVEMSLVLFLCNEVIILYNLGQPEGPAIKYSRLIGRGVMYMMSWPHWRAEERRIYCPLIYFIFALNCWLDRFKENYHHGFLQEQINPVAADLQLFSRET